MFPHHFVIFFCNKMLRKSPSKGYDFKWQKQTQQNKVHQPAAAADTNTNTK